MTTVDQGLATQIANIEKATGRSLGEWNALIAASGLQKHGQIVAWLKTEYGLSHGTANRLALKALEAAAGGAPSGMELVDAHYSGRNTTLRPLYDLVIATVTGFGPDVELAPKKAWVSVRRRKQFAIVGPAAGQLEIGVTLAGRQPTARFTATEGMATHKVRIANAAGLDKELIGWLHDAYEAAG